MQKKSHVGLIVGGIGVGLALATGIVLAVVLTGTSESEQSLAPSSRVPSAGTELEEGVLVEITGIPEGAKIIYNGAPVPMNPFRASRKKTIVPLRVEAEGFEPFATSVVPEKDLVLTVELRRKDSEPVEMVGGKSGDGDDKRRGSRESKSKGKRKPTEAASPEETKIAPAASDSKIGGESDIANPYGDEPAKKKINKGKKGTLYSEEFE